MAALAGAGKYDHLCTYVREQSKGAGAIVIVFGGERGSGFSVQGDPLLLSILPPILRQCADEIENSRTGKEND